MTMEIVRSEERVGESNEYVEYTIEKANRVFVVQRAHVGNWYVFRGFIDGDGVEVLASFHPDEKDTACEFAYRAALAYVENQELSQFSLESALRGTEGEDFSAYDNAVQHSRLERDEHED